MQPSFHHNPVKEQSKGWRSVDTRGRFLPGRLAGLVLLLDDSLSLVTPVFACASSRPV
jgi:hypothetical protein